MTRARIIEEALTAIFTLAYIAMIFGCWIVLDPTPDRANPSRRPAHVSRATSAIARPCAVDGGSCQPQRDAIAQLLQSN